MPALTEDQILAGLLHGNPNVRSVALRYFADCDSPNPTVMPVAIEALERFGRTKTVHGISLIARLTQTEPTIRWAVRELQTQPRRTEEEEIYVNHICRLLCDTDPRLVMPFERDIAAASLPTRFQQRLNRRLELLNWSRETLWLEIETICDAGKDKTYTGDICWSEARDMVEELARRDGQNEVRMMELLGRKIVDHLNDPLKWLQPLMVMLAGELRFTAAVSAIVADLHEEDEVLSEECLTALVKIGGEEVIRVIRRDFPTAAWHFRLYGSGILGRIHTDQAVPAIIELLDAEDGDIRNWLAQSLVCQFSTEGNEVARQVLLADPDLRNLRNDLINACTLMGQDFPELQGWREEEERENSEREQAARRRKLQLALSAARKPTALKSAPSPRLPSQQIQRKVGRNDPCSCGSGKKYKKCCMNKIGPH